MSLMKNWPEDDMNTILLIKAKFKFLADFVYRVLLILSFQKGTNQGIKLY
jgi:hypothetical protein